MPDFVRRVLTAAHHHELFAVNARRRAGVPVAVHPGRAREGVVVGQGPVRVHPNGGLDDLSRAGVDERRPDRRARLGAVYPLDHMVAGVHRVHVRGHVIDAEAVDEPGRLEDLVPPHPADLEGRAVWLGHGRIEVVDDRLDRLAHLCRGVGLDQPVATRQRRLVVVVEGLPEVEVPDGENPDPGVEAPGRVPVIGEHHQRVMLPKRHRPPVGCVTLDFAARPLALEGERRLHLRVLRERLRPREEDGAAARIQPVAALVRSLEPCRDTDDVTEEKRRRVDQRSPALLGDRSEASERRGQERLLDGPHERFGRIGFGAEARVVENEHHLRPDPLEVREVRALDIASVEPQRVGADPGRERRQVEELLVPASDLEEEPAPGVIPVEGEVARLAVHPPGVLGNRRKTAVRRGHLGGSRRRQGEEGYGNEKCDCGRCGGPSGQRQEGGFGWAHGATRPFRGCEGHWRR